MGALLGQLFFVAGKDVLATAVIKHLLFFFHVSFQSLSPPLEILGHRSLLSVMVSCHFLIFPAILITLSLFLLGTLAS